MLILLNFMAFFRIDLHPLYHHLAWPFNGKPRVVNPYNQLFLKYTKSDMKMFLELIFAMTYIHVCIFLFRWKINYWYSKWFFKNHIHDCMSIQIRRLNRLVWGLENSFLAHLSWKLKWAFLIAFRPASVRPSVCLSVRL